MKIKVKVLTEGCMPIIIKKGDWIDLYAAETIELKAPQSGTLKEVTNEHGVVSRVRNVELIPTLIPLGVAMKLPKGFEALILPRSSTPGKFGIIEANSSAVIDNSYCGNGDEWRFCAASIRQTTILKGQRICQFRIQLSQKATFWQKLRWLFSSKIELVRVNELSNNNRGGFGTTGK